MRLRSDVRRRDGGRVLVGGSPVRAVRLSAAAQKLLATGRLRVADAAGATLARRLLAGNLADPELGGGGASEALTVVIPVRDRAGQLDRCLRALTGLPVIVVDDASHDPEAVAAVAQQHGARLLPLARNVGPAGARNAGLAQVHTPLVAFVDSDVVVTAGELRHLSRHCADPLLALVAPRVVGAVPGSARTRWFERYDVVASSMDVGLRAGQVAPLSAVGWLPAACLVGRVAHLGAGFDDRMRVAEDVDLVWRLIGDGLVVRYDPTVQARHDVRRSVRNWLGRKFLYGTGGAELAARHGALVAPAVLSPTLAVAGGALLLRRWWSVPVAAGCAGLAAARVGSWLPLERDRSAEATRLVGRGLIWALRQQSSLLLRHWWPITVLLAPFSPALRRVVGTAVVVDQLAFHYDRRPGPDVLLGGLVARRCDDLAYGAGLWWGAIRRRSPRCLLPQRSH